MGSVQGPVGKDVAWYAKELPDSFPRMRKLLEEYSGIPANEVDDHIKRVRDQAWEVYPYGSVGMFGFLTLNMPELPAYNEIVQRCREGQVLLDLGCCFAQELRPLKIHEGAKSENLWGADLHKGFMDVGYDLFQDKDKIGSHFIAADIFDPESELKQLDQKVDIVHAGSFFHLFSWDDQVKAAKRVVGMLKHQPDSLFVGRHAGDRIAGDKSRPGKLGSRYRHNAASWEKLWRQVGQETGTNWHIEVEELADQNYFREGTKSQYSDWNPENTIRLQFTMRLIE